MPRLAGLEFDLRVVSLNPLRGGWIVGLEADIPSRSEDADWPGGDPFCVFRFKTADVELVRSLRVGDSFRVRAVASGRSEHLGARPDADAPADSTVTE